MKAIFEGQRGKLATTAILSAILALGVTACGPAANNGPGSGLTPEPSGTTGSSGDSNSRGKSLAINEFSMAANGETVIDSGKKIPITSGAVTGYIDNAIPEVRDKKKVVSLSGWAASSDFSQPANAVVAFAGQRAVAAVEPTGDRPDVASGYNKPGLKGIGFVFGVPLNSSVCSPNAPKLQVVGLADGLASSIQWLVDTDKIVPSAC